MKQGQVYPWTFLFDPEANNGRGVMRVTLGGESVEYDFRKARFDPNAEFDRFGLFTLGIGGAQVKVFFDDLAYTVQQ